MKIGGYEIKGDAEQVTVFKVGVNQKTKEETLQPIAYVGSFKAALESIQRKNQNGLTQKETVTVQKMIDMLEAQHSELLAELKKMCPDLLKHQRTVTREQLKDTE